MCTLVLAVPAPGGVLQVAANRDEFLARPAAPPEISADGRWLAPRDLQAGGTWLGMNAAGLFVGVTNRSAGPRDDAGGHAASWCWMRSSRPTPPPSTDASPLWISSAYNGFHLAYADGTSAGMTWSDGRALRQERLAPGLHVLTEQSPGREMTARAGA